VTEIDDIPIWLRAIYGFLEITAVTMFLTTWLNLSLTWQRKLFITLCVLVCVLSARILFQNVFYVAGAGIVSYYFLFLFLARVRGLQVIISILTSYLVLIIFEPVTHLMALKLLSELDYIHIWLISGFPNLVAFILLTYLLVRVRQKSAKKSRHETP